MTTSPLQPRRVFLCSATAGMLNTAMLGYDSSALRALEPPGKQTEFQLACMTLPYAGFPLKRALTGIAAAGYRFVAWGTTHQETAGGKRIPVMPADASPEKSRELAGECRDMGLEPLMMFSTVYPEAADGLSVLTQRIKQAAAGGIGQVLTFGHTKGGNRKLWVDRFRKLGPIARDHGVLVVVKQHGGSTGTGQACAEIIREVDDDGIQVNYDAGNVMDYLNVDPIPDIQKCTDVVRSFCMKDHRNWPKDQDCGPGFGEIDHYRLLHPVAFTGRKMPLCCENIFAPIVARPTTANGIDALARQVREYLQTVIAGVQA
ncbi:MAG: TIM barrel protein [Fuerstiella sp.]|nr:TIM barrel protein [Fuerstiella sp.]MCP4853209.1 TIM barrel protein [Fuerstiella sp.]